MVLALLSRCFPQVNARNFVQSSGGLSYLAATVRRFRGQRSVGDPFFRHLPLQDWLEVGHAGAQAVRASGVDTATAQGSPEDQHVGLREAAALEAEDRARRSALRDGNWMAPKEQAAHETAATFTKPRVWKVT